MSQRGGEKLAEVCRAYAALFALGPEQLRLRGLYTFIEGEPGSGRYDRIDIARDELVQKLLTLASWAESVAGSPDAYILHLGV